MSRRAEKEHLNRILGSHLCTIHETLQVLDQTAASSLDQVNWEEIIKMGEQVSKQATIVGMLWTGEKPEAKAMEETMTSYFNTLQGFLLLSHGSTVGAGPTLSSCIHASVKQVVDSSFRLMKEFVSLYGSYGKEQQLSISQLVGAVWEACSSLKKTPSTNITAIGRGMTQVAVSTKDVLRELKELKPVSSDNLADSDDELGNDLSPEEMKIAQTATVVVSDTLSVIKELIRSITGFLKLEKPKDNGDFVDSLEKLLKMCQELGLQIDEIGACLYPPQEVPVINSSMETIHKIIDDVQREIEGLKGSSETFVEACNVLRSSLRQLASELSSSATTGLEDKVENITLSN
ncbi:Cyclin-D1-binding protein 1 like [Senna tora]|uniref:Cyclin-D1-binding protein 1 like n=1 Tax=Senna tora TaxID=362788 RepID=A0A834TUF3_9FABA|nr:Cyclin-D1-binding protein 1 like [Senna tora]